MIQYFPIHHLQNVFKVKHTEIIYTINYSCMYISYKNFIKCVCGGERGRERVNILGQTTLLGQEHLTPV